MIERTLLLVVTKTLTLTFGGLLTYLSFKAYRRTNSTALRALSLGIGLVTVGAIFGGLLHQFGGVALGWSVSIQSVFTATGFAILTYSLYTGRTEPGVPGSGRSGRDRDHRRTADD